MIREAENKYIIRGLAENLIPKGVAVLQYADDTIIYLKDDLNIARNMKLLLYLYEMMSGLKIYFAKSEVIVIHGDEGKCEQMADLFKFQIGCFPVKYLGVPVSPSKLHVKDRNSIEEKNEKKLVVWKGGTMSIAGRTTLINSSLSNTIIYHMSMYLLPKTVSKNWISKEELSSGKEGAPKKYRLVKWTTICKSKKKGGLGIKNIRKMNISLLCK
jgi:hypothetical protein